MRLIDLSQPLYDQAPNCPAHPRPSFQVTGTHATNDGWHMEALATVTHTGSHCDAPLHIVPGGKDITQLPLDTFVGPARIADLRGIAAGALITPALLAPKLKGVTQRDIVLLATGWGDKRARTDEWLHRSPMLGADGARWLVERGVRGVGIDHYTIGDAQTHTILLSAEVWIVEELKFPADVFSLPQPQKFWALPMNWPGCSGAFCRPVLEVSEKS
jgi:arylformamidase